jgi:predicted PurR-regulated permease PerM
MMEVSVNTKLWSLIVIMLLFIIIVGAVGYATLNKIANTVEELVGMDEAFLNLTDQVNSIAPFRERLFLEYRQSHS